MRSHDQTNAKQAVAKRCVTPQAVVVHTATASSEHAQLTTDSDDQVPRLHCSACGRVSCVSSHTNNNARTHARTHQPQSGMLVVERDAVVEAKVDICDGALDRLVVPRLHPCWGLVAPQKTRIRPSKHTKKSRENQPIAVRKDDTYLVASS